MKEKILIYDDEKPQTEAFKKNLVARAEKGKTGRRTLLLKSLTRISFKIQ